MTQDLFTQAERAAAVYALAIQRAKLKELPTTYQHIAAHEAVENLEKGIQGWIAAKRGVQFAQDKYLVATSSNVVRVDFTGEGERVA